MAEAANLAAPPALADELVRLTLGIDAAGDYYATLDPDNDPHAGSAKGRLTIGLSRHEGMGEGAETGALVVTSLVRESETARKVVEDMPEQHRAFFQEITQRPKTEGQIFGVKFTLGGSAEGRVVDTGVYDSRGVQAALDRIERQLAEQKLAEPQNQPLTEQLVIGGAEQRAEARKSVAAMDRVQTLSGRLHATLDASPDVPTDKAALDDLVHRMVVLDLDVARLNYASTKPEDAGRPDITTQRQVVQEMASSWQDLVRSVEQAPGQPLAEPDKPKPSATPGKRPGF